MTVDAAVDNGETRSERAHADLMRERYGPVVPTWELRTRPTPVVVPREGLPDTPANQAARRDLLKTNWRPVRPHARTGLTRP